MLNELIQKSSVPNISRVSLKIDKEPEKWGISFLVGFMNSYTEASNKTSKAKVGYGH